MIKNARKLYRKFLQKIMQKKQKTKRKKGDELLCRFAGIISLTSNSKRSNSMTS